MLMCPLTSTVGSSLSNKLVNIELAIGYKCDAKCTYCYQKNCPQAYGQFYMQQDVIDSSIVFIKDALKDLKTDEEANIIFDGGEPLYYVDIIDHFIEGLGREDKVVQFTINTNGFYIHKFINKFKYFNNKFNDKLVINVSYDYFLQNKNRQDYSYKKIRDNIKLLDKNNIKFFVKTVIPHEDLVHFSEMYKDYYELKQELKSDLIFDYTTDITYSTTIDDITLFEINDSIRDFITFIEENNIQETGIPYFDNLDTNFKYNCSISFYKTFAIDYTGQLYPCMGSIFTKDKYLYSISNIKEVSYNSIKDSLFNKPVQEDTTNSKCIYCGVFCSTCSLYSNKLLEDESDNHICNVNRLFYYYANILKKSKYSTKSKIIAKTLSFAPAEEVLRKKLINWIEGRPIKIGKMIDEYYYYGQSKRDMLFSYRKKKEEKVK